MKVIHAKFGKVEILKVENKMATVKLENGETKILMTDFAIVTDDEGNKVDLKEMNVMREFIIPSGSPKESKLASIVSEMNDHKQFNHLTKSYN